MLSFETVDARSRTIVARFLEETIRESEWCAVRIAWIESDGIAVAPWRLAPQARLELKALGDVGPARLAADAFGDSRFFEPTTIDPRLLGGFGGIVDGLDRLDVSEVVVFDVQGGADLQARVVFVPSPANPLGPASLSSLRAAVRFIPILLQQEVERGELSRGSLEDPLTGLLNRRGLDSWAERISSSPELRAVVFVDIDRFKAINDNHGHGIGDEILVDVAARLSGQIRPTDFIGRLGGDEFVMVAASVANEAAAQTVAHRLVSAASGDVVTSTGEVISVAVSAGVVLWKNGQSFAEAVNDADVLMFEAKRIGGGVSFRGAGGSVVVADVYNSDLTEEVERTRQPVEVGRIVHTATGELAGAHAILGGELSALSPEVVAARIDKSLLSEGIELSSLSLLVLEPRGRAWLTGTFLLETLRSLRARSAPLPYVMVDGHTRSIDLRLAITEAVAHGVAVLALSGVGSTSADLRLISQLKPRMLVMDRELAMNLRASATPGLAAQLVSAVAGVVEAQVLVLDPHPSISPVELAQWNCDFVAASPYQYQA